MPAGTRDITAPESREEQENPLLLQRLAGLPIPVAEFWLMKDVGPKTRRLLWSDESIIGKSDRELTKQYISNEFRKDPVALNQYISMAQTDPSIKSAIDELLVDDPMLLDNVPSYVLEGTPYEKIGKRPSSVTDERRLQDIRHRLLGK